ncbi:MAG: hypothetical protein AAB909_02985 [Patescibacteria group bacterium]
MAIDFLWRQGPKEVVLSGNKGPIVGINGWLGGWAGWLDEGLISYAKENNLGGVLLGLGLQIQRVDSYLERVHEAVGQYPGAILVGISMGGLIAVRYVEKYGFDNVRTVLTVASPYNGISFLRAWPWSDGAFRDLAPNSSVLRSIQRVKRVDKIVCIQGRYDEFAGIACDINLPGRKVVINAPGGHNELRNNFSWSSDVLAELMRGK